MKLATKIEPSVEKLDSLFEVGFQYLEIYTNRKTIDSQIAVDLLTSYPFQYAVHSPVDYFDETVVDFAYRVGATTINTHKIITNERLSELVQYAAQRKIAVTVENEAFPESHHLDDDGNQLPGIKTYDPVRSGGDFWRLERAVPGVKLCIDIEHAMIRDEFPSMLDSCSRFLGHIHLCGYIAGGKHHQPVYNNMTLVEIVVKMLRGYHYTGFVVCEHDLDFHTKEIWAKTLEKCNPLFGV